MMEWIVCYYCCTVYVTRSRSEFDSLFEGEVAVCDVVSGSAQCSALSISFLRLYSVYSLLKLRNDPEIVIGYGKLNVNSQKCIDRNLQELVNILLWGENNLISSAVTTRYWK
jgi:hypothetical protein